MDLRLDGRLALVTGSTKGIGYAVARGLAELGASVIINGRGKAGVQSAIAALRDLVPDGNFLNGRADLLNDADLSQLIEQYPAVDILVNNVGAYSHIPFFDISDEEWLEAFRVNVLTGVRVTRHYLRPMLQSGWGRIVNVASESGGMVPPEMLHYGVSKAAQLAFSRGVAELTAGTDVTVNAVVPGPTLVDTVEEQVRERAQAANSDAEAIKRHTFEVRRPSSLLKRYTTPQEIAHTVCFVCSPASSATNGAPVRVDGGILRGYI